MHLVTIVGLSFALLTAGCSSQLAPKGAPPPSAAAVAPAPAEQPASSSPAPTIAAPSGAAARETATAPVAPPATIAQSAVKPASPAAKAPAAAAKAPVAEPTKKASAAPEVAKKAAPTLDLTSLEQRLKNTDAIGVLTRSRSRTRSMTCSINSAGSIGQAQDHAGRAAPGLRPAGVEGAGVLQDSDPALASAIVASREAIWGILSDPAKFATI
jgi:hypothetical protein